jgi:hypothetical protein
MAKARVIVSTDIGGSDPDDMQSMAHALLYADKVNYVGFISSPTGHGGRTGHLHTAIDAYEKDFAKLKTWSSGYQDPDYLHSIVTQGRIQPQPSQGFSSATEGSKSIIKAAKESSEPLYVLVWGAMTDVAQALHDDPSIKSNLRVISLGSWNTQQDPTARNYVYQNHKDLWWIESKSTQRGMYVDDSGAERNAWKMSDAKGHGALGDYFYEARPWGLKMGDTPSLLYLLDNADNNNPAASSWGGAYVKNGHGPNYWTDNPASSLKNGPYNGSETVQKYQAAIYADMAARFDHAKSAKSGSTAPVEAPQAGPVAPAGSGQGNGVTAVDDHKAISVNQVLYHNSKYLTLNDKGLDGGLKVSAVDAKSKAGASVSWSADGTMKYQPLANWQGTDSFDYTVVDRDGSSDRGTLFVKVGSGVTTSSVPATVAAPSAGAGEVTQVSAGSGQGNGVTAVDDYKAISVNQVLYHNSKYLTWNDKGLDGGLKVSAVDAKSKAGASVSWSADGTMKYQPLANWQGTDSFDYTVVDRDGSSDRGTLFVKVGSGVASSPTPATVPVSASPAGTGAGLPVKALDDHHDIKSGTKLYFDTRYLLMNDKAPDGGLHVTGVDLYTRAGGRVSVNSEGSGVYIPKAGFTGQDSFDYRIADVNGSTDTGTVFVDVLLH